MNAGRSYFDTNSLTFNVVRIVPGQQNVTREYLHFTDVVEDTVDARVWQGLHFRSADVQGARIGKNVADWVSANFFQPAD